MVGLHAHFRRITRDERLYGSCSGLLLYKDVDFSICNSYIDARYAILDLNHQVQVKEDPEGRP